MNKPKREEEKEFNIERESSDEEDNQEEEDEYVYETEVDIPCESGDDVIAEESSQNQSDENSPHKLKK